MAGPVNANLIATLLEAHAAALQRYAAQWTVCPDDCVQDAFVKLAGQAELPDSLAAWLYRVVKNGAINRAKGEQRREKHERLAAKQLAAEKMAADKSRDGSGLSDEQIELETALAKLNATDRELIVLRIWSQLTWEEIANLTDQSSSGAQRHYVAALKKLKFILEQSCSTNSTNPKNLNTTQIDCRPT
ncbi:sigma-70 family RNA polymerase sigma factor [Mariniblastus sp.]|nr:sigma-70 family RNA polymerase sigma factor [Mariniblastus sp.]